VDVELCLISVISAADSLVGRLENPAAELDVVAFVLVPVGIGLRLEACLFIGFVF
jgi:hypothetical protein